MATSLAAIDFLNSREKAVLLWVVVIVAYATVKSDGGVGSAFVGVVHAFLAPKLLLVFGSAALYCAGVVFLASRAGLWHPTALKETIYWFLTGGAVLVGRAVSNADPFDRAFYGKLLRQAVRFTIVIEFLVNLYVFPLLAELVLVPVVLLFVAMQVVAAYDASQVAARKVIDGVLTVIGFFLLSYVAIEAIGDPGGLFARENLETLLIAPALTAAFLPLLWACGWISRREQDSLRRSWRQRSTLQSQ